jgi:hypothetical protein
MVFDFLIGEAEKEVFRGVFDTYCAHGILCASNQFIEYLFALDYLFSIFTALIIGTY